jgi:DNA-binding HxlR family transcriptional regulator
MANKNENKNICALDYAFQRLGGKYKGRILYHLHCKKIMRYGELHKNILAISTKMLTQTLKEMEEDGLISRKIYKEIPPKVEYSLTQAGEKLIPVIETLYYWGEKQLGDEYDPNIFPPL